MVANVDENLAHVSVQRSITVAVVNNNVQAVAAGIKSRIDDGAARCGVDW